MEEPAATDNNGNKTPTTVPTAMVFTEAKSPAFATDKALMPPSTGEGASTVIAMAAEAAPTAADSKASAERGEKAEASEMKATRTPEEPTTQQPQAPTPPAELELSPAQMLGKKMSPSVQQQQQQQQQQNSALHNGTPPV